MAETGRLLLIPWENFKLGNKGIMLSIREIQLIADALVQREAMMLETVSKEVGIRASFAPQVAPARNFSAIGGLLWYT